MGVEYCHYLFPRPNSFRPSPAQLVGFVEALAADNWIAVPGSKAMKKMAAIDDMSDEDACSVWAQIWLSVGYGSVPYPLTTEWFEGRELLDTRLAISIEHGDQIGLRYPLINDWTPPEDPYYDIQLHLSLEYVQHVSELIHPINAICECGEDLEYYPEDDIFYASRIRNPCPQCARTFDPSAIEVVVRDGWTGEESQIRGGTIYRFAIAIDCHKCIPERKSVPIRANPALLELCERQFGQTFYEVADVY